MEYGGYIGRVLWVNLTDKTTRIEDLNSDDARNFIGGYGLGAKVLYECMEKG